MHTNRNNHQKLVRLACPCTAPQTRLHPLQNNAHSDRVTTYYHLSSFCVALPSSAPPILRRSQQHVLSAARGRPGSAAGGCAASRSPANGADAEMSRDSGQADGCAQMRVSCVLSLQLQSSI